MASDVAEAPLNEHHEVVFEGDEIEKMDKEPQEPSEIAPKTEFSEESDRLALLVESLEGDGFVFEHDGDRVPDRVEKLAVFSQ